MLLLLILLQDPSTLLQVLKFSTVLLLCLPFLSVAFFFMLCFLVLILPVLFGFVSACLIIKVVSLEVKFATFLGSILRSASSNKPGTGDSSNSERKNNEGRLKEKREGVELDPFELPSLYGSEEEECRGKWNEDKRGNGRKQLSKESLQILVPNKSAPKYLSSKREEHKSFYEVLTFWKQKEEGEM